MRIDNASGSILSFRSFIPVLLVFMELCYSSCNTENHGTETDSVKRLNLDEKLSGKGEVINGYRVGPWIYTKAPGHTVVWVDHRDSIVKSIVPYGWQVNGVSSNSDTLLICSDSLSGDYLTICDLEKKYGNLTARSYQLNFLNKMLQNPDILTSSVLRLKLTDGDAYFGMYGLSNNEGNYGIYTYCVRNSKSFYEIVYKYRLWEDGGINELIFWDFLNHLKVGPYKLIPYSGLGVGSIEPVTIDE